MSLPLQHVKEDLVDGELTVRLDRIDPAEPLRWYVPAYQFDMMLTGTRQTVGHISLRVGNTDDICLYAGHIGYGVLPEYRGKRFAARATRLLFPLAKELGLNPLWITCNPENLASRRTCELAGAVLEEIVLLPPEHDMAKRGSPQKCRYRVDLT